MKPLNPRIDPLEWQAYVDGELDAEARDRVEASLAVDPALAETVARDMRMRARLRAAYDPVLEEAVPERFRALLAADAPETGKVVALPSRAVPAWIGYALAASIAAVAAGLWWRDAQAPVRVDDGAMLAGGALARGLDQYLASEPDPASAVGIGSTFRDRDGRLCRSFSMRGDAPMQGLACRDGARWRITVLVGAASATGDGLRQAAAGISPVVMAEIEAHIDGDALMADEERAARDGGWR